MSSNKNKHRIKVDKKMLLDNPLINNGIIVLHDNEKSNIKNIILNSNLIERSSVRTIK